MKSFVSIKGCNINYDENLTDFSIGDILLQRFDDPSILDKTIDDLHNPYLMKDMDKAVKRLKQAKEKEEKIMIFGDYDVDGVTSTSLLMHLFTKLGMKVSYRLPHRVEDGYGLKTKFVDEALELGVTLMITVDCGSRDREIVADAAKKGLDIIVTDHHSVPKNMPTDAIAFINPTRPDCDYPFPGLAGAGVAFKLVCAFSQEYLSDIEYNEYLMESIDIAAIGTVTDCMQLVGENRIIVRYGLEQVKYSRSKGLRMLVEDRIHEDLDGDVFGFHIGPRLNAAGRMDTPYKAVNLILNNGESLIHTMREIESLNDLRKLKTAEFVEYALEDVNPDNNIIMYVSSDISHGIIGIVAGRLTERYYKPSIVLIDEGDKLIASCRAPEFFSIVDLLEKHKKHLIAFGGHKQAAGFSILKKDFPAFQKAMVADVNAQDFSEYKKELRVDKIIRLDEIGFKLIEQTARFKPFGMGNPKPLFMIKNFEMEGVKFLGKGRDHLRLTSRYGFKIFAFGMGEYYDKIRGLTSCDVICELAEDNWQGKRGIMIRVVDIIV